MIPIQRQQLILEALENKQVVSINELVQKLNVSHMTIRRDIQKLEQQGLLIQVSGGVKTNTKVLIEPSHIVKETLCSDEKKRIGKAASEFVKDNSCIYLDAGTTSLALCENLSKINNLTVVTNDFVVVNRLMDWDNCTLIHIGGLVRKNNRSSVGYLASQSILSLRIDMAFISTSSFDLNTVTTPDMEKVNVKRAAIEASTKRILITDSSKFGCVATYRVFNTTELHTIITDTGIPESAKRQFAQKGIEVIAV